MTTREEPGGERPEPRSGTAGNLPAPRSGTAGILPAPRSGTAGILPALRASAGGPGRLGPVVLVATVAGIALATAVLAAARPFQHRLGAYTTDLEPRSPEQRRNIAQGARRLDGAVIEPGATLSFNAVVGPRTRERGFLPAPAFLEGARLESIGGGICQVSSTLYNAALLSGLEIRTRVPHDRVVRSVPPGADATVWYGKADLVIANPADQPVRVSAQVAGERLTIGFDGPAMGETYALAADRRPAPAGRIRVRVYRTASRPGGELRRSLVSDDTYSRN